MLFDHVDLRVRNLAAVRGLTDALLPAMGLDRIDADEESAAYHSSDETGSAPFVWLVQEPGHSPAASRLAFAASSRIEVDRLAEIAHGAGAQAYEAPAVITEYGPNYYATFFEDADGNKYEICCRRQP